MNLETTRLSAEVSQGDVGINTEWNLLAELYVRLGMWDKALTAHKRVDVEQSYDLVDNRISLMNSQIIKLPPHIIDR